MYGRGWGQKEERLGPGTPLPPRCNLGPHSVGMEEDGTGGGGARALRGSEKRRGRGAAAGKPGVLGPEETLGFGLKGGFGDPGESGLGGVFRFRTTVGPGAVAARAAGCEWPAGVRRAGRDRAAGAQEGMQMLSGRHVPPCEVRRTAPRTSEATWF